MNGFAAILRDWLSDENLSRLQKRVKTWWKSKDSGWKDLILAAPKLIVKMIGLVLLAIIAVFIVVQVTKDSPWTVLWAAVPVVYLLQRRFKRAGMCLALIGSVGIAAWILNLFGVDGHAEGLYGSLIVVSLVAIYRIDRKALGIAAAFVALALITDLLISVLGGTIGLVAGGFPTDGVIHLVWIMLAVIAAGVAWLLVSKRAAAILTAALCAAGYSQFVWGYAGLRWQEPVWFGHSQYPDQAFYGLMLLVVALAVALSPARPPRKREAEEPKDESDGEGERIEQHRRFREESLGGLYYWDKRKSVLYKDGSDFLAWALPRADLDHEACETLHITPAVFDEYAARRAVDEIRTARIIRKDGTVNPNKLAKLGFRKDFLDDHGITKEELLTGKLIELD